MKKLLLTSAIIGFIYSGTIAQTAEILNEKQVTTIDVNGKWVGKRQQYTTDHKGILQTFEYEFNLKQEGSIVTGTSSIFGSGGYYGDMKLRGVITGNKLMFEEYEILSENLSNTNRTWCFKTGELTFAKDGNNIKLLGATPSHIPGYNIPCSGGYSNMEKVEDGSNAIDLSKNFTSKLNQEDFAVNVLPNPFFDKAKINFLLDKDSKVELNVLDMSGKTVATLQQGKLEKGNHEFVFDAQKNPQAASNYIVVLKINGTTYSSLLSKINY